MDAWPSTDWDLFQSLHAVLEAGTLSAAAKLRGLTQPTLGRHIETLEQQLGAPLFLRSPRGLQPTDLALELRPHLNEMAAAASAAVRDASGAADSLVGSVRITASEIIGVEVLPPMLTDLPRTASQASIIELMLSNIADDLSRREADIAVRMTPPTQGALVAAQGGRAVAGLLRDGRIPGAARCADQLRRARDPHPDRLRQPGAGHQGPARRQHRRSAARPSPSAPTATWRSLRPPAPASASASARTASGGATALSA